MWMPFYNAIVVHFDAFSSYYSGFTTYSTFRRDNTISYYTPNFGGFSAAVAYSYDNGATKSNGELDDRMQATISYDFGDVTISGGIDKLGGANDSSIIGTAITWQATDDLFLAAKYEQHRSDLNSGYGADGDHVMNILAAYTMGKNTFKATVAEVEGFGETVFHLGWDYQYQDNLKFFVEYYNEEETAAITSERGGASDTCWSCSGGQVVVTGLRYDF
jgi:predicted porin